MRYFLVGLGLVWVRARVDRIQEFVELKRTLEDVGRSCRMDSAENKNTIIEH